MPTNAAPTVVDLDASLVERGDGVHWTLDPPSQLNLNLARLEPGHRIAPHRNDEVDVALVVVSGEGELLVEDTTHPLQPNTVAHVPRGLTRGITASPGGQGLSYLTTHTRRSGPTIGTRRAAGDIQAPEAPTANRTNGVTRRGTTNETAAVLRRRPIESTPSHPPVRAALLMAGVVLLVVVLAVLSTLGT